MSQYVEKGALASSIAMYVFGTMGTLFVLMVVLAAGQYAGLSEEQQAQLASIDLLGYVVGTLIAVVTINKFSWRSMIGFALGLVILFNGAGVYADNFLTIAAARFLVEIGSGIALALGMAGFGGARKPDRAYAIALAILMTISWAILLILPQYLSELGPSAIYFVHMGMAVITLSFVASFPKGSVSEVLETETKERTPRILLVAMSAILLYMIAEGGTWALAAVIGENIGLANEEAGEILGWSLIVSALAAALAALLSTKYGRLIPTVLGLAIFGGGLVFLLIDTKWAFIAGMFITQGLFGFLPPYLALTCMDLDPTNRYAAFIPTIQILGYAIGPGVMSLFVEDIGLAESVVYVGVVAVILSIILSIPLAIHLDKKQKASELVQT